MIGLLTAILVLLSAVPPETYQYNVGAGLAGFENLKAFRGIVSFSRFQIEMMGMKRADDLSVSDEPLRQRSLPVRTPVLGCEESAVSLTEHGDFLIADDIAATLSGRDRIDAAKIDGGWDCGFSHCFRRPPARKPTRDH